MLHPKTLMALRSWSGVARWALFGTLSCILISLGFNALIFGDLGPEALRRAIFSATLLPMLLGMPLFIILGMRVRGLALSNMRLGLVARTDSLTSCLNRGAFTSKVTHLIAEHDSADKGALLMIDADNFKAINDRFGHDNGDEALSIISRSIRSVLRSGDLVGRVGGEEFAVYLPDLDYQQAQAIAERIRRSVNLAVFSPDGRPRTLSVSIGGAVFNGRASFAELFRIADQRLYRAKQNGRNCATVVSVADVPVPILQQRTA